MDKWTQCCPLSSFYLSIFIFLWLPGGVSACQGRNQAARVSLILSNIPEALLLTFPSVACFFFFFFWQHKYAFQCDTFWMCNMWGGRSISVRPCWPFEQSLWRACIVWVGDGGLILRAGQTYSDTAGIFTSSQRFSFFWQEGTISVNQPPSYK